MERKFTGRGKAKVTRPGDHFERNPEVVHRRIKNQFFLLPIRPKEEAKREFYFLEGVGERVWGLLDGKRECRKIVEAIASEFDARKERIEEEVFAFLNDLAKEDLIRRVS